ncbi:hypothetical protein Tco_0809134 [Tanacetum coccineum]
MPAPDLRTMEELCQPTMNGRGGPIAPVNIQATDFGLKNHMIQLVQNSYQFHGLLGDDANKHLNKFLTITQSMKQNGVTDDALRLYLFSYSLTHHATAWFNHTFYNGLTLRHRDTINAAAGGTFIKRRPEECYDLIENMTAHHNDWDTLAHRGESFSSTTSSSEIAALAQQMIEMIKDMIQMYRSNQQVNSVTPSCGHAYQPQGDRNLLSYRSNNFLGPPSFNLPNNQNQGNNQNFQNNQNRFNQGQGYNQNRGHNFNQGNNYNQNHGQNFNQAQPNVPSLEEMMLQHMRLTEAKMQQMQNHIDQQIQNLKTQNTQMVNLMGQVQKALQERPQGALPSNTIPNPRDELKEITTLSGIVLAEPLVPLPSLSSYSKEVERDSETITDQVLPESTTRVPPLFVQSSPSSRSSEIPLPTSSSFELPKRNPHQPQIPYPSRLNKEKLQDKSDYSKS